MDPHDATLQELLHQAAYGDAQARERFVERYGPHILRIVRRQMPAVLRTKFDSIDFVQDVWASFFSQAPPPGVWESPHLIAAYLRTMTTHKMAETYRQRLQGKRRNVRREVPYHESAELAGGAGKASPTASQLAVAEEEWEVLLRGLPAHYVRILELRREGQTVERIAQSMSVSVRTVTRVIQQLFSVYEASRHAGRS